jgi:hypothetical protein
MRACARELQWLVSAPHHVGNAETVQHARQYGFFAASPHEVSLPWNFLQPWLPMGV